MHACLFITYHILYRTSLSQFFFAGQGIWLPCLFWFLVWFEPDSCITPAHEVTMMQFNEQKQAGTVYKP